MISISGKKWTEIKVNKNLVEKLKQDFNFSEIVSRLIVSRKIDPNEVYFNNDSKKIYNIFNNNEDFDQASDLLINSIKKQENICILGDYDVDGTAATSLLVRFFDYIKHPHFYYIPDRVKDGYGASKKLFKKIILKKPKLIILVDCGSTSNEAIDYLNQFNIKSIIIDHHEINKPFPKSNIIINPKKNNGYKHFDNLCATTLTYFFLDILIKKIKSNYVLSDFLIFVLLATVCDVMPLKNINRLIASIALKNFEINKHISIKTLFDLIGKKNKLKIEDLAFLIGPIINSGGRIGKSNLGTELLSSKDQHIVTKKSKILIELNNKRKKIEKDILDNINYEKIKKENKKVIIYYEPNINEGLIGIIAARLKEYFDKPSIVVTNSNNVLKGSARSTTNYNIGNFIKILKDKKIILNGGGHSMAAGFTLKKNKIEIFDNLIQKNFFIKTDNFNTTHKYDFELSTSAINYDFIKEIDKLGPYGTDNIMPIFFFKNLKIIKSKILDKKHISLILKPNTGKSFKSICFNCMQNDISKYLLNYKKNINVIGQIYENIWNNKKIIQLNIKDIFI